MPTPGSVPAETAAHHAARVNWQSLVMGSFASSNDKAGLTCRALWAVSLWHAGAPSLSAYAEIQKLLIAPAIPVGRTLAVLRTGLHSLRAALDALEASPFALAEAAQLLVNIDFTELVKEYYDPVPGALMTVLHHLNMQMRVLPATKAGVFALQDLTNDILLTVSGALPVEACVARLEGFQLALFEGDDAPDIKSAMALELLLAKVTTDRTRPRHFPQLVLDFCGTINEKHAVAVLDPEDIYSKLRERWQSTLPWRTIGLQSGMDPAVGVSYLAVQNSPFYSDMGRALGFPVLSEEVDPLEQFHRIDQALLGGVFEGNVALYAEFSHAYCQSINNEPVLWMKTVMTQSLLGRDRDPTNIAEARMPLPFKLEGDAGLATGGFRSAFSEGLGRQENIRIVNGEVFIDFSITYRYLKLGTFSGDGPDRRQRVLLNGDFNVTLKMQAGTFVVDSGPNFSGPDAHFLQACFQHKTVPLDVKPWQQPGHFLCLPVPALQSHYDQVMATIDALQALSADYALTSAEAFFIHNACERLYQLALVITRDRSVSLDQAQLWHQSLSTVLGLESQEFDIAHPIHAMLFGEACKIGLNSGAVDILDNANLAIRAYGVSRAAPVSGRAKDHLNMLSEGNAQALQGCFPIVAAKVSMAGFEAYGIDSTEFARSVPFLKEFLPEGGGFGHGWEVLQAEYEQAGDAQDFETLAMSHDLAAWHRYGARYLSNLQGRLLDAQGCLHDHVLSALVDFSGVSPSTTHALTAENYYVLAQEYAVASLGSCLPDADADVQGLYQLMGGESPQLDCLKLWVDTARAHQPDALTAYSVDNLETVIVTLREANKWSAAHEAEWRSRFHQQMAHIGRRAFAAKTMQKVIGACEAELDRACLVCDADKAAAMQFTKNTYLAAYKARNGHFTISEAEVGWYTVPETDANAEYQEMASGVNLWLYSGDAGAMPPMLSMPEDAAAPLEVINVDSCLKTCHASAQAQLTGLLSVGEGNAHPNGAAAARLLHLAIRNLTSVWQSGRTAQLLVQLAPLWVVPCVDDNWRAVYQRMQDAIKSMGPIGKSSTDQLVFLEAQICLVAAMPVLPATGGISAKDKRRLVKPYLAQLAQTGDVKARLAAFERIKIHSLSDGNPFCFFHETDATGYRVDWNGTEGTATSATWYNFELAMCSGLPQGSVESAQFRVHNVGITHRRERIRENTVAAKKQALAEGCLLVCNSDQDLWVWMAENGPAFIRDDEQKMALQRRVSRMVQAWIGEIVEAVDQAAAVRTQLAALKLRGCAVQVVCDLAKDLEPETPIMVLQQEMEALGEKRQFEVAVIGREKQIMKRKTIHVLGPAFNGDALREAWKKVYVEGKLFYRQALMEDFVLQLATLDRFIRESCFVGDDLAVMSGDYYSSILELMLIEILGEHRPEPGKDQAYLSDVFQSTIISTGTARLCGAPFMQWLKDGEGMLAEGVAPLVKGNPFVVMSPTVPIVLLDADAVLMTPVRPTVRHHASFSGMPSTTSTAIANSTASRGRSQSVGAMGGG